MNKVDISIKNSINYFIIDQIGSLIPGGKSTAYVKFLLIINCIEFLGAALSESLLDTDKQSEDRFNNAIKKLFPAKYKPFTNASHAQYFYTNLRCGMIHQLRPLGGIGFTTKAEAKEDGNNHLERSKSGLLVIVLEDFYDDLKKAALKYIRDVESGKITTKRSADIHISVFDEKKASD